MLFVRGRCTELRGIAARALSRDADEGVRAAAALGLAATSEAVTLSDDVALLIRALRNEYETQEVRRSAYEALLLMFHRSNFPSSLNEFDPATQVDWYWIENLERLYSG